jgi:hypothetical protein
MSESFAKIATGFNVLPLQVALKRQPKLFGAIDLRRTNYLQKSATESDVSPHVGMKDIWIRYNDITPFAISGDYTRMNDEHTPIWYPAYYMLPQIRPLIFDLMRIVEGEQLGGIFITKLSPGAKIEKHIDGGWHAGYYDKYYIPIQNAKGATFNFEDGTIDPDLGDVYWFDNSVPHWVENNTTEDRISLIITIRSDRNKGAERANA